MTLPRNERPPPKPVNEPRYAGIRIRAIATVIDFFLLGLLTILGPKNVTSAFCLLSVIPLWFYLQATPGKLLCRIHVVDAATNQRASFRQCAIRGIAYVPSLLVLCLGFVWIAFDLKHQGWHDKIANTAVIES